VTTRAAQDSKFRCDFGHEERLVRHENDPSRRIVGRRAGISHIRGGAAAQTTSSAVLNSAQAYRGTRIAQAAVHCDRLVTLSRDSAKEATAAAAMHKDLAGGAR